MKNINAIKITLISLLTMVVLSIIGLTYAYFSLEIEGTGKDISMTAGDLRLIYKDETDLKLVDAMPGDEVSKVITVTNAGTRSAKYSLYWGDLINTIENFELHATLDCKSYTNYGTENQTESGTCDKIYRAVPISDVITSGNIKKGISIEPGITQEYTVTVKFDNKTYPQDNNLDKTFTGKIGIEEYTEPAEIHCTFDGELTQGVEYVNGQYTYRYKQGFESKWDEVSQKTIYSWKNIDEDGWGVALTNKESTEPVTSKVCTYINDKPLLYMSSMFGGSQAVSIDLSSFNTKNVVNMYDMFFNTSVTVLDLSNFDTSNVKNMSWMFEKSNVISLDLSNFDTSKVTYMNGMFSKSAVTSIDLSNFDTSNVTDMKYMFFNSEVNTIDLSNFDTSKVTDMRAMFQGYKGKTLDVSNFNTSNVTDMRQMFNNTRVTSLDVSNFDTGKVTSMSFMFCMCDSVTLDVSNFDTSNVTDMSYMFGVTKINTINVSNFNTSNVTDMKYMFDGTMLSSLDLSSFNTSNVTNMSYMFRNSYKLTTIYVSNKFLTNKVTSSSNMFSGDTKLVGGAGTVYDSTKVDKTYARVDGGTSSPGYFTAKQ